MSGHALFSPSAAHRWMECPGSFSYPGNTEDGESSVYADDGTASHHWAALALKAGADADDFISEKLTINGKDYVMDEERAEHIQTYLDTVRQASSGFPLKFVEHWVSTAAWLGEGQGGTVDFGAISPTNIIVADLKYGMGERVEAFWTDKFRHPNHQLALYAAGLLEDATLLGMHPLTCTLIVCQPRLGHVSSETFSTDEILAFARYAAEQSELAARALILSPAEALARGFMNPGDKQCRWCRYKAECPALARKIADEVRMEFDVISEEAVAAPKDLGQAMRAVPLIEQWCEAVRTAVFTKVAAGEEVIGADGLPMKLVEGKMGNRKWTDPEKVAPLLVGQLGPKAYEPQTIISAPAAAKILDRKKTAELWKLFEEHITRAAAKPVLAEGSDVRAPYTGDCRDEFERIDNDWRTS